MGAWGDTILRPGLHFSLERRAADRLISAAGAFVSLSAPVPIPFPEDQLR